MPERILLKLGGAAPKVPKENASLAGELVELEKALKDGNVGKENKRKMGLRLDELRKDFKDLDAKEDSMESVMKKRTSNFQAQSAKKRAKTRKRPTSKRKAAHDSASSEGGSADDGGIDTDNILDIMQDLEDRAKVAASDSAKQRMEVWATWAENATKGSSGAAHSFSRARTAGDTRLSSLFNHCR